MVASGCVISGQTVSHSNGMRETVSSTHGLSGKHHHKVNRSLDENSETTVRNYKVHLMKASSDQDIGKTDRHQPSGAESPLSARVNENLFSLQSAISNEQIHHQTLLEGSHMVSPYLDTALGGMRMNEKRRENASNSPSRTIDKDSVKTINGDTMVEENHKPDPVKSGTIKMTSNITKGSKHIYHHENSVMSFEDGDPNLEPRIVGGIDATIQEFPFMASLRKEEDKHHCGSVLVSNKWLLTAGHCLLTPTLEGLVLSEPKGWFVLAGLSVITNTKTQRCERGGERREVVEMLQHPHFFLLRMLWDLGMVRVEPAFRLSNEIMPAHLPSEMMISEADFNTGTICIVTGWGQTSPVEEHEFVDRRLDSKSWGKCEVDGRFYMLPHLQKVYLPLLYWEECDKMYHNWEGIREDATLCTLSEEEKDACHGDSGGPLICYGLIVGIVSWGGGDCGKERKPGVYARVDPYVSWIQRTLLLERKMGVGAVHTPPAVVKLVAAVLIASVSHL